MASTVSEIPTNTLVQQTPHSAFSSPGATADVLWTTSDHILSNNKPPRLPNNAVDEVRKARLREARKSLPVNAINWEEFRNQPPPVPSIPDRRKSTRPKSIRVERSGGGVAGVARGPSGRSSPGLGPRIPIKVEPFPSALGNQLVESPLSTSSPSRMEKRQSVVRSNERPITPEESDAFQDAPETAAPPSTPSAAVFENNYGGSSIARSSSVEEESVDVGNAEPSLPTPVRHNTAEKVQDDSRSLEPSPYLEEPTTPSLASVPALPLNGLESQSVLSPTKQPTIMDEPGAVDEDIPSTDPALTTINLSPDSRSVSRERSTSPTGRIAEPPPPPSSPPKPIRSLSRDLSAANARPSSTSPSPRPDGLARTASTRLAGFLGRMGSVRRTAKSPPMGAQDRFAAAERRGTHHSIHSLASNGGESLATIEDDGENDGAVRRPTLQAQFRNLRIQEEHSAPGVNGHAEGGNDERMQIERTTSDSGPPNTLGEGLNIKLGRSSSTPGPLRSPALSPNLPPGTASGLSAGPAEEPRPVDWDLWQTVVYEGPAAVARTSGEELNRAIASGIPAAIRGVVWQVLAESKSPEMEDLYRTLKARGTAADVEQQRPAPPSRNGSQGVLFNSDMPEKDWEVASSKSSVHSERSTPATSTIASQTTPPPSVLGDEADAQARAKVLAEKTKREAAALTKLEKAIKRDLGSRTSFSKYTQAAGLQDGLFGLCKAYALLDDGVGYAQGINFIAMPLLFNMTEEEAFTLLVRLMSKYDVRSMFAGDMAGLHLRLYQFERLLEDRDPALYCHLRRKNVGPQLYATQWFLTLFAYRFPLQLVLRVYDLLFSQGLVAILKFGLVLMEHNREALLEMKDMSQLTNFLKDKLFDVYIDKTPSASSLLEGGFFGSVSGGADKEVYRADEMVRDACNVEISEATLAAFTAEWEESQRATLEREAELENLRTTNANLSTRVKTLEERTQQQDNDHVSIAGDVVRIKVENDALQDENEGLKIKIEELQKFVDTQPAELETKFKEEMARVLERNSEVQSENRQLKEEMEEMEKQLVEIKMKHAEAQQDHDELSRKWANVQALLKS